MLYAANVWAYKSQTKQLKKKLDQITRLFAIKIIKSHRTVSLTASAMLAGILPLDLRTLEKRELYEVKRGKPIPMLPGRELERPVSPFALPHPAHRHGRVWV